MAVLVLTSDLATRSQITSAARQAAVEVTVASSVDSLLEKAAKAELTLVILDLVHQGLEPAAVVPRLKELLPAGAQVLAFGPHVHKQRLAAAAEAGCDAVVSRGQLHSQLSEILQQHA